MSLDAETLLWIAVGALGAGITIGALRLADMDGDRATWPLLLIFVALLYVALAVGADDWLAAGVEALVVVPFVALAVFGHRHRRIWVAAGLLLHGVVDLLHVDFLDNPGVPDFYPALCIGYDVVAAAWLLVPTRLRARRRAAT